MNRRGNGEGSVYKTTERGLHGAPDRTRWIAQVWVDGRKVRRTAATNAEAKRLLKKLLEDIDAGSSLSQANATVAELLDTWLTTKAPEGRSEQTLAVYEWACAVLKEAIGRKRVATLTPEDVEHAFAELAEHGRPGTGRPMSKASLAKIKNVLRLALDFGYRRKYVTTNIAREVVVPHDARATERKRALTSDEVRAFLVATADHRLSALWRLLIASGMRIGEATGLTWTDVDFDSDVIHVRRSLKLVRGNLILSDELKTNYSARSLRLNVSTVAALAAHRERQQIEAAAAGPMWGNTLGLAFTTPTGGPLNPNSVRRQLDVLTDRAGLARIRPHDLRHAAASTMSAAGVPIEQVADVLGHHGVRMLTEVYRHQVGPTVDGALVMGQILDDETSS